MTEKSESGTLQDLNWEDQEIEIADLLIAVSEIQENDLPEKQTSLLESLDSFVRIQSEEFGQEPPESQSKHGPVSDRMISADPEIISSRPGPSKSSNVGEQIEETPILTSQERKKSQGTQTDGSSSAIIENRKRSAKKRKYSGIKSAQIESRDTPGPPLNEEPKKNPETSKFLKNQKTVCGTKKLTERKKYWECDHCGKKLKYKFNFARHFQSHNATSEFDCRICGKVFKTDQCRQDHEERHTATTVQCKKCGKECKNRFALKTHQLRFHTKQEKSVCGICDKTFKRKDYLRQHEKRVHELD
jgi:hypothetical protein